MENDPDDYAWLEAEAGMEEDPVTVSLGPMGSLFQQLRSAIAWQYRRLKGVKTEIQILGEGLEGLCTDLKDLSEAEDTITRCWVRQVRDLCYDTSDYLDELIHYSSGTRPRTRLFLENRLGSKIFRVSRRPACSQLRLSLRKVKKLKRVPLIAKLSALVARVEDADERRTRFKLSPPQYSKHDYAQAAGVMPQLPLQLHVDKLIKLLGFDHDHDHDERNLKVVTILGYAGVGKTEVARTLYHQYRGRFQCRAFLRVSRDPDTRRLLADLLSQIKAPPAHAFSDVEGLIATITKHLHGKRYLIVIDDLWDTSTWNIISRALPDGDCCRIITTEVEDAALAVCSDQFNLIYEITPLNDDQSEISEGGCTEGMKEALNLVYNNLPPHLKTCLLYLNIYPEGWTVKKDELVKQWVAEGFIGSVQGQDPEETAGCYFDALVGTGMIQSVDTNHNDVVLSCTLHHMVLDLVRQKSMEENFVTIVNYFHTILGLPDKVRRLSVQLGGAKGANNISGNMRISQVRSLIFCGFFKSVPSFMEYELLRLLILHIWSDQDRTFDLTTIGELYRLRYLKIECSSTVKLPHKIRRLQQLGTLQVDARLYAVPSDIVHLEKLLHLGLPSESILPNGFGRMTCLRTLGCFDLGYNSEDNVRDLGELKNLQELQLTCPTVQSAESLEKNVQLLLGSVLKKLRMLQSVTLVPAAGSSNVNTLQDGAGASSMSISCDSSSSVSPAPAHLWRLELSRCCCTFSRLPKWLGELTQLRTLKIAVRELSEEDTDILKGLPALTALSLHVQPMSAERIVFGKEGFSVLTYFKFACTVPWLKFEAGAMPNLEKLKLCFNCPIVDEQGTTRIIIIERLLGLKEISALVGSAGVDAVSAWRKAIRNDPGNPKVQLMGSIYYGDHGRGTVTCEGSGEDENNEANIRVHMQPDSSRLPVPAARYREEEPEDRPLILISVPSKSETMLGHTGQISPCFVEDEMLDIKPLEVSWLPSELKNEISCSVDLTNEARDSKSTDPRREILVTAHMMEKYEPVREIGSGNFGVAKLMRNKETHELVAMKFIERGYRINENVFWEIVNHRALRHPNIIRFREVVLTPTHLGIVMEYAAGGELFERICDAGRFHEDEARYFFQQLVCGVSFCHAMQICHRDLKLENILLDGSPAPRIKICDLRCSKSLAPPKSTVGTPEYIAPEVLSRREYDGKHADVWSCGVTLYVMLVGGYPFEDTKDPKNFRKTIARIMSVQYKFPENVHVSQSCRHLLSRIFVANPHKRITMDEIKAHPWFLKNLPRELKEEAQQAYYNRRHADAGAATPSASASSGGVAAAAYSAQSVEEIMKIVQEAQTVLKPDKHMSGYGRGAGDGEASDDDDNQEEDNYGKTPAGTWRLAGSKSVQHISPHGQQ